MLKTWIQWWLGDRYRWRRRCGELSKLHKELRRANADLQERLYIANRDRLEAEGRVKQLQDMWVHEGAQWREQLDRVLVWLARAATGFGPGDKMPVRESVALDSISSGKLHPADAVREMIRRATTPDGRNT